MSYKKMNRKVFHILSLLVLFSFIGVSCTANKLEKSIRRGKDVVIQNQSFSSALDLTKLVQSKLVTPSRKHAQVKGNIVFINCVFNGFSAFSQEEGMMTTLEFCQNLVFHNCAFNNTTDLSYVQVNGDFSMLECELAGPLTVNNAWFRGKSSSFTSSKFMDKVKAVNCMFDNRASFLKAEFEQSVSFQKTVFKGKVLMNGITFNKYAGFDEIIFQQGVSFDQSVFKKEVLFDLTSFLVHVSFDGTDMGKSPSFKQTSFYCNTSFNGCVLPDSVIIEETQLKVLRPVFKE